MGCTVFVYWHELMGVDGTASRLRVRSCAVLYAGVLRVRVGIRKHCTPGAEGHTAYDLTGSTLHSWRRKTNRDAAKMSMIGDF